MSISLGYSCVRYVFLVFNVFFWTIGWGSLGLGIWLYLGKSDYETVTPGSFGAVSEAGLCIAIGVSIIVITFVGWGGAWLENKCLLLIYFVLVLLVFLVEFTVGILGCLFQDEFSETIKHEMMALIRTNYILDDRIYSAWNSLQNDFKCCGVVGADDWFRSPRWPQKNLVPESCCLSFNSSCIESQNSSLWHSEGCYKAFSSWLLRNMHIVGACALAFSIIQILGLITSLTLYCRLRDWKILYRRQRYYCRPHDYEASKR